MRLSIVTINYNNADGLRKTLASVAAQTYRDIEHIIVDGGSTDGSVDIIREYAEDQTSNITHHTSHIVKWSSEPDKGIYNAMNKGIEIALGRRIVNSFNRSEFVEDKHGEADRPEQSGVENKGIEITLGRRVVEDNHTSHIAHYTLSQCCDSYVWILNSGDCVASPTTVEQMMGVIKHQTSDTVSLPILMGNIVHVYGDGRKAREKERTISNDFNPRPIDASMLTFYSGTIPHDAAFVKRELFEKYGYFDETMKICADWKLYLDMIALGGVQPWYVDIDVVLFDMSGISNTNNELRLAERREYLEQVLPTAVLKDYEAYAFPIEQYRRLKKHHLWGLVYFMERVLFKLERWKIIK